MPTGYSAPVEEGCSFEEYVWGCARAFGACITLRDSNEDIPKKFEESSYHKQKMDEIESDMAALLSMDETAIREKLIHDIAEVERKNEERRKEWQAKRDRNLAMIARAKAWEPPTPDHVSLREFMISQILDGSRYYSEPYQEKLPVVQPLVWKEQEKARLMKDFVYHRDEYEKDKDRNKGRNEWIAALRASVPQPTKGTGA